MSLRFSRRLSILPGVRLNFSGSGISATIGVPGASVTLGGRNGATANLGLSGTGLSFRTPLISGGAERRPQAPPLPPTPVPDRRQRPKTPAQAAALGSIQSEAINSLTTTGLAEFRDLIVEARERRSSAERELERAIAAFSEAKQIAADAQSRQDLAEQRIARLEASFFRSFKRGSIAAAKTELVQLSRRCDEAKGRWVEAETQRRKAEDARDELWVDTEFQLSGPAHAAWRRLSDAFSTLMKSECAWDVTADRSKRSGDERSSATRVVDRRPVSLSSAELSIIQSKYDALQWQNANGGDLFVYPGFVVMFQDENTFALLDLKETRTTLVPQKFQETDVNPRDAKRVGTAWKYSNRDGTPDRRYTNNSEIPVLLYGEIRWESDSGLSEAYMFSNAEAAAGFVDKLEEFRRALAVADPGMDDVFRRVDFQPSNFSKVDGTTRWNFDCKFVCRACGGNVIHYDDDGPSDGTVVTCKNCGQLLGSYGQLMAGARYVGTQQIPSG